MPFKFHLKKSRQYNVVSKNQYVICAELLDQTSIECTLSIESIGQECLNNITQRMGLGQPEFFGLRYISREKQPTARWVDMDKPLKRQLEKEAKSFNVYLRVMYYITDFQLIHDEMTRYHYYLQLKCDMLEGRIQSTARHAVLLTSYSMQADLGNYDPTRHTPECLQPYAFFDKDVIAAEPGGKDALLNSAICHYKSLAGVTQAVAEELYISLAMQAEGYGQESFPAKDDEDNEVLLGISINGIMAGYPATQTTQVYRWKDISNVIYHKKSFKVESQATQDDAKQFFFQESRSAKYIWRLCIVQHTFYTRNQETRPSERLTGYFDSDTNDSSEQTTSVNMNRTAEEDMRWTSYNDLSTSPYPPVVSVSSTELNNLRALLPSYRPAPDYDTAVQMKYNSGNPPQPYYVNQSTIAGTELSCLLGPNVVNQNRY